MTSGASNGPGTPGGGGSILTDPRQADGKSEGVDQDEHDDKEATEEERALVDKRFKCYDDARKFDENFRKQVAIDRRYAAGTSDLSWAVTTNLIGAFIDILVALLYARNPDVSVRKAPQVDESNTYQSYQTAKDGSRPPTSLRSVRNRKSKPRSTTRKRLTTDCKRR